MELEFGRPGDCTGRLSKEIRCYDLLDSLGISYQRIDHAPAMTMEACQEIDQALDAVICKNLLLCNRQISHHVVRIQCEFPFLEQINCFLTCSLMVTHQLVLHRETAEPEVLTYGTIRYRRKLLMNHGNTSVHSLERALELDLLSIEDNLARGARLNANQALHQCRLTCTILTHQSVNSTGANLQLYAFQSSNARKFLDNVVHFEDILFTHVLFTLPFLPS